LLDIQDLRIGIRYQHIRLISDSIFYFVICESEEARQFKSKSGVPFLSQN